MFTECLQVLAVRAENLDAEIHRVIDEQAISGERKVAGVVKLCILMAAFTNFEQVFTALIKNLYFVRQCICYVDVLPV